MELTVDKVPHWVSQIGLTPKIQLGLSSRLFSEHCQIDASNDLEAINCWLQLYRSNINTFRSYLKESKRLLLWCVYERGLSLGELKVQDFEQYFNFLKKPPSYWYTATSQFKDRSNPTWLPLKKGLSEAACRMAIRAVNSLLNYLVNADYLRSNPLKLLRTAMLANLDFDVQKYKVWERILEPDEWAAVQKTLREMPTETSRALDNKIRIHFLFSLLYFLGIRIHEATGASWNAFRKHNGNWWFFIKGKGGKLRHIPVHEQLLLFIKSYRLHLGLAPLPGLDETASLFISKKSRRPLKVRQLYGLVKAIGLEAAKSFVDQPLKKRKLEQLSPHWLRHLCASHQDRAGVPGTVIQSILGHNSFQTTQIYQHAEDELRMFEIQKLKIDLEPQSQARDIIAQAVEFKITLKGSAMSGRLNLSRLLDSIETNILKNHNWIRNENDKDQLLDRFERLKKYGIPLEFVYSLGSIAPVEYNHIQQLITRESTVRLFDCEFEWKR